MRPDSVCEIWCSCINSGFLVGVVECYFLFGGEHLKKHL